MNKILTLVFFLTNVFILSACEVTDQKNAYSIYGSCEIPFHNDLDNPITIKGLSIESKKNLSILLNHGERILICSKHDIPYGISYFRRSHIAPLVWDAQRLGFASEIGIEHLKYNGKINISSLINKSEGVYRFDENGGVDFQIFEAS